MASAKQLEDDGRLHIAWASSCCQPWSTMGRHGGMSDRRSIPLLVWQEERRQRREEVMLFENSACFPLHRFIDDLPQGYRCFSMRSNPEDYGWPVTRPRLLCFAFDTSTYAWCGPSEKDFPGEVLERFGKTVASDGDIFCAGSAPDYEAFERGLSASKGIYKANSSVTVPIRELLPPAARNFFDGYKEIFEKGGQQEALIADLNQNPLKRKIAGKSMPSLTTRTLRYSFKRQRLIMPEELWAAHGWPSVGEFVGKLSMPFSLRGKSHAASLKLLGNGVHVPSVAIFTWFCLSNLLLKSVVEPLAAVPASDEEPATEGDRDGPR